MMAGHSLTLEDTEYPIAVSLYGHPGTKEQLVWLRVGRAMLEICDMDTLNATIRILNEIKTEAEAIGNDGI